jgi:DNA-binding MarR family transcriptional regulator
MKHSNTTPCEEVTSGSMPEIFHLIDELEKRLRQFQEHLLKEAHLTPPQYYILSLLAEKDARPFKELADVLACTRATVTGIVDTMEKKGLVVRAPNPDDRRSLLVKMTEKGFALLQSTPEQEKIFGSCCCDVLPPDEAQELSRLLKKLAVSLPF